MKYKRFFAIMLGISVLISLTSLITPVFLQIWNSRQEVLTGEKVLLLISLILLSKGLHLFFVVYRERFAKNYNKKNFSDYLCDFFAMNYDDLVKDGPTNILERMAMSVNSIYSFLTGDCISLYSGAITAGACLILFLLVDLKMALLLFLLLPVNYFSYRALNQELARRSQEMQMQTGQGFQQILSYVGQVDYLKQSADHTSILRKLDPALERVYGSMARVNEYAQSVSTLLAGLNEVAKNGILIYSVYAFAGGSLSPYLLLLINLVMPLYFSSVNSIVNANVNRRDFDVALKFRQDLEEKRENDGDRKLDAIDEMDLDVSELAVPGKTIPFTAKGTLKKGDIVKICGESGAGKSSFAKTLLKFRPVQGVSFNGILLSELTNRAVRERVEYLPQSVPIIKGSLLENLQFGCEEKESDREYFEKEPILKSILQDKNMDTEILEAGANLSGGEKQKIAVARALRREADVLILDEICSNIDKESSDEIYERIRRDRKKYITFIITHDELPEGLANVELNR